MKCALLTCLEFVDRRCFFELLRRIGLVKPSRNVARESSQSNTNYEESRTWAIQQSILQDTAAWGKGGCLSLFPNHLHAPEPPPNPNVSNPHTSDRYAPRIPTALQPFPGQDAIIMVLAASRHPQQRTASTYTSTLYRHITIKTLTTGTKIQSETKKKKTYTKLTKFLNSPEIAS